MSLTFDFAYNVVIGTAANEVLPAGEYPSSGYPSGFVWRHVAGRGGNDRLVASQAGSSLIGGAGNDTLDGGDGNDTLYGFEQNLFDFQTDDDSLFGGAGNDSLFGGQGADWLSGGDGTDTLDGEGGNDTLIGDGLDTYISGGSGFDVLRPLAYTRFSTTIFDFVETLDLNGCPEVWFTRAQLAGFNSIRLTTGTTTLVMSTGGSFGSNLFFSSTDAGSQFFGSGTHDSISLATAQAAWRIFGQNGDDTITGSAFADTIDGGLGNDSMSGGGGNDHFIVADLGDVVNEAAAGGIDTAWVSVSGWTAPAEVEIIRLYGAARSVTGADGGSTIVGHATEGCIITGGAGADMLYGGAGADSLVGLGGSDTLDGQGGGDTLVGGADSDHFIIRAVGDVVVELAGGGTDTAWVAVNGWTNGAEVEIIRLSAPGATVVSGSNSNEDIVANQAEASVLNGMGGHDVLWGSAQADTLNGGAGDDIMRSQGGNDVMTGGTGNDQYVVSSSGATVTELPDEGYDVVHVAGSASFALGAAIEEARLYEAAASLTGNAAGNLLVGNNGGLASTLDGAGGDDTLWGTAAADRITGGAGNDTIYSQGGADRFVYAGAGWGIDEIGGFVQGDAKLDFTGSGVSFGQLTLVSAGGNATVLLGAASITVFGVASLTAGDFLF